MDEIKLLESLSKMLGDPVDTSDILKDLEKIEKEKDLLKIFKNLLHNKPLENIEQFEAKLKNIEAQVEIIETLQDQQIPEEEQVIVEEIPFQAITPQPEIPIDFVTAAARSIRQTKKEILLNNQDNTLIKEIDQLKKSVLDLHTFASQISNMGGGGEVNLRYLDDINRGSILDGNFLKYNASSKKFEFTNVTSDGVDWKHIPSDMIPEVTGTYSLGNSSVRWESLWVGSNSATFSSNIYITSSNNTGITFNDSTFQNTAFIPPGYISTVYINANVAYTNSRAAYIIPPGSVINGNRNITLGSNNTYVIGKTGNYILNYSIQYKNTGADAVDIYVWVNKNNAHLEDSSTVFSIHGKKSTNDPGKMVAVTPIFFPANTGDLIQVLAATPYDTTVSMVTIPAVVSPDIPRTPASIITITEVS